MRLVCKSAGHTRGMRRVTLVLIAMVALAAIASTAFAGAGANARSKLKLVQLHPLVVRGTAFRTGERVRVTVYAKIAHVEKTTASSSGAFRMSFGNVAIGRCSGFRVTAVGNLGSRASLKLPPLPACLPA